MQDVMTKKKTRNFGQPKTTRQFIRLIKDKSTELNKMVNEVLDLDAEFVRFILKSVFSGKTVNTNGDNEHFPYVVELSERDRAILRRNIALSSETHVIDFNEVQMSYFCKTIHGRHYLYFQLGSITNDLVKPMTQKQSISVLNSLSAFVIC